MSKYYYLVRAYYVDDDRLELRAFDGIHGHKDALAHFHKHEIANADSIQLLCQKDTPFKLITGYEKVQKSS